MVQLLESKGFEYRMPSFLSGKQYSTSEANLSRITTKIRWVIESVNGRIKKWKYFANILSNQNIPFIEDDFKNICAIINRFRPQIASTNDQENEPIYKKMIEISKKENVFVDECMNYKKRILKKNQQLDPMNMKFPILTEDYLQRLTFGIYQINQAKNYTAEHLDENGNYLFEVFDCSENESIIHVKIRSRFTSQTIHDCWIKYDPNLSSKEGQSPISNWYCMCKCGARVFGMCAHITSV